jgi:hypothetical protein
MHDPPQRVRRHTADVSIFMKAIMEVLAEKDGKIFSTATLHRPDAFMSPFAGVLFPCLIWDHEGHFRELARSATARALLEAGCRYAVCAGKNCEAWHDAVDMEFVKAHLHDPDGILESVHVMTSCHHEETPDDVAFFFVLNTNFDNHEFRHYLVLHVGTGPARDQVNEAVRKYVLGENAV